MTKGIALVSVAAAALLFTGAGALVAKAGSAQCGITVRTLRGSFAGTVTRSTETCLFARKVAEESLRTIIRSGGVGNGNFSTRASSYRVRCAAKGDLYSQQGLTVDCRVGAGGETGRVFYGAGATLALGSYLDYSHQPLGSYTHISPEGVPMHFISGSWVDHPDGVAQWGLREYAYGHRRPLMTAARWLANHQRSDGGFAYEFDVDGGGVPMLAPWISAMAQGQAISVLARAYQLSGSPGYLRAARRALEPFLRPVPTGVTSWWNGHRWYEEYPSAHSKHVLNGFMFSLVGLHDLAPRSLTAWRLWRAGVRGLRAHLQNFDVPDQHSQLYAAIGSYRVPVGAYYRQTDATLINTIARWTHDPRLRAYARRWTAYTHFPSATP